MIAAGDAADRFDVGDPDRDLPLGFDDKARRRRNFLPLMAVRQQHAQTDALIIAALSDDPAGLRTTLQDTEAAAVGDLVASAEHHGVTMWVASALAEAVGNLEGQLRPIQRIAQQQTVRVLCNETALEPISRALHQIPWVAVKGPVLAGHVYARKNARSYGDIDVIVGAEDFPAALDALIGIGGVEIWREWGLLRQLRLGELPIRLRNGAVVDLHWSLGMKPTDRECPRFAIPAMIERRRYVDVGDISLPTVDQADALIHLCTHAVRAGGHRLCWALDLQQAVLNDSPHWPTFVDRAHAIGAGLVTATALQRAGAVLHVPIPDGLTVELARDGRAWLKMLAAHDRINPPTRSWDRAISGSHLVRATGATTGSSLNALGRSLLDDVIKPMLRDPNDPWRRKLTRKQPGPQAGDPLLNFADRGTDRKELLEWIRTSPNP